MGRKYLDIAPLLVPVPGLDGHVVAACENNWCSGVDCEASNVVWMGFKSHYFFVCIVVEDPELIVVRACNKPVFPSDKPDATDRDISDVEGLYDGGRVEAVDAD